MTIQFNTDKTINGDQKHRDHFSTLIKSELDRYSSHITRVEVHLSDKTAEKNGLHQVRCLLEVRFPGKEPIAVTNHSDTDEKAVSGALDKAKAALETILGKLSKQSGK